MIAKVLASHGCFTCMHKFYSVEDWVNFAKEAPEVRVMMINIKAMLIMINTINMINIPPKALPHVAASSGTGAGDFERLKAILAFYIYSYNIHIYNII